MNIIKVSTPINLYSSMSIIKYLYYYNYTYKVIKVNTFDSLKEVTNYAIVH